MITGLLIFFPLAAAIITLLLKGDNAKKSALIFSVTELIIALYVLAGFRYVPEAQFVMDYWWVKDLGISFKVGIDGISLLMVLLTTFLTPLIILSARTENYKNPSLFYALVLAMEMALIGVFVSLDSFLFYVFWELALIPVYFICLLWGGDGKERITFKFFIYTLLGSLLMLVAFIYLYFQTPGTHTFDIHAFYNLELDNTTQGYIFWALFLAFAIKMPVFPLHTWQPDTYTVAPTQGTMLLSGIMLKMGIYGVIRWLLPVVPLAVADWGKIAVILAVAGIVYASCIAIVQKDLKRLIAYSSIAHVGLIAAGIFTGSVLSIQGSMIQMLSHGINVIGLFFVADIIFNRTHTNDLSQLGGIRSSAPRFATLYLIILLGSVALPLTNGFIGEFMLLGGLYKYSAVTAGIAGSTIILGAVYMLSSYQRAMLGEKNNLVIQGFADINANEKIVLTAICAAVLLMGIYPNAILQLSEPAVTQLVQIISGK